MATFKSFEDIEAWQKARALTNSVYDVSEKGPFARDFGLRDQIRRACVSTLSNIAEGFERSGTGESVQFLSSAKGSAGEVRVQLYVALDRGYINAAEFDEMSALATQISRMTSGLMAYLKQSGIKGTKYKQTPAAANLKLET